MFEELQNHHRFRVLTIRWADGLQVGSGFTKPADHFCCVFLLYPIEALLPGEAILEQTPDWVWDSIYGTNWQLGNEDGSCYIIISPPEVNYPDRPFTIKIATEGMLQLDNQNPDKLWFYQMDKSGTMEKLTSELFQDRLAECQFPRV